MGHGVLERVFGIVLISHQLCLLGTQFGNLHHQWIGVELVGAVAAIDRCLIDLAAQVTVVQAGQQRLLGGVDDDDGVGCFLAQALSILGALCQVGLTQSCQVFLLVDPHHGVVGGVRHQLAPLLLQVGNLEVDFLHTLHLLLVEQGTVAHKLLVGLFKQFLVLALQFLEVSVIDLLDALKQWLVEGNLVLQVSEFGQNLLLCLGDDRCLVGLDQGKEDAAHAVKQFAALVVGQDSVLKRCRVLVLDNLLDLVAFLLDGLLQCRQVVLFLNFAEVGSAVGQRALLQQRVVARVLACGELGHTSGQHHCHHS